MYSAIVAVADLGYVVEFTCELKGCLNRETKMNVNDYSVGHQSVSCHPHAFALGVK